MKIANELEDIGMDYKPSSKEDVEKIFKTHQDDRIKLIGESIDDIRAMIKQRGELHNDMLGDIDKLNMFIDNNIPKQTSSNPELMSSRHDLLKELLKKKIELEEVKIEEKLNFFRDVALLKKELREHIKEYGDMENKVSMLDNIMGLE